MKSILRISDIDFGNIIHSKLAGKGGVYRIFSQSNQKPQKIGRLLESDDSGTLYIGKADLFTNRAIELKKSTDPEYTSSSHEFGSRYKKLNELNEKITKTYPYETLYAELIESENPRGKEKELLEKYIIKIWRASTIQ